MRTPPATLSPDQAVAQRSRQDASVAASSPPAPASQRHAAAAVLAALTDSRLSAYFAPETGVTLRVAVGENDSVEVLVEAPSRFLADRLRRSHSHTLRQAAQRALGEDDVALRFHVAANAVSRAGAAAPRPLGAPSRGASASSSPAGWRRHSVSSRQCSLRDFVVGPCNRLAHAAAVQIANLEEDAGLRTLVLHGGWGLGKTHLLQGAADLARQEHPDRRIVCMTAEAFTNRFIEALQSRTVSEFRRLVRRADLLCLDDAQHLAGKPKTLQEVVHALDDTHARGGRVLLVFDRSPALLDGLPEDLRSRLVSGLVVELETPDDETRVALAQRLTAKRGLKLSPESLALLRRTPMRSVRELQGCLARAEALHRLMERDPAQPIGLIALRQALAHNAASARTAFTRPPTVQQVLKTVCDLFVVDPGEVLNGERHARVVLARSIIVKLLKELTTMSYPEIARALRRPNHSSVITAARRLDQRISSGRCCDAGPRLGELSCEAALLRAREAVLAAAA